jgi:peptidoglycan-N-acetylglucosamine deacetylase
MDRRQALASIGAAGVAALLGGAPDLYRFAVPGRSVHAHAPGPPRLTVRPDPGYARGRPLQVIDKTKPVHNLHDLIPAAPLNAIALTIDDGPHPRYTPMMLDLLAEFQVPATFNMIGTQVTENSALVQRLANAGHQVADHTVTHPLNLPRLSAARIEEEIAGGHDRVAQVTGIAPKFFRAPGGNWSPQVIEVAAAHGMICVDWQVDPRDWSRPGTTHIVRTLLAAKAGDILLCHDGGGDRTETIEALRTVIPALKQRGLVFVAL